jgi:Ecdysteroid kinase-like family
VESEPLPGAASAEHLTGALRRSGVLRAGCVNKVAVESSRPTLLSRIIRLSVTYDEAVDAPGSLILKTGLPNRVGGLFDPGQREVEFYTQVAGVMSTRLFPRCFDAEWDPTTKAWHLLLEDLTDSHIIATRWPLPPTMQQCEHMLHALARFHAEWWGDPRLGISIGTWLDADAINRLLERFEIQFKNFADRLGDRLPPERRDLYEQFLGAAPGLFQRYHRRRHLSLIHGDAHVWNYFLSRDGGDDIRLFDWDAWRIGVASNDLAYMMATHWYPDRRRRMERALLDHYHTALTAHGVSGYDRGALDDDYRLSALLQIMTPVWQAAIDLPPAIWWSHLERIMLAVDDLGCRDLLA